MKHAVTVIALVVAVGMSRAETRSLQQVAFEQLGPAVTPAPKVSPAKPVPAARCALAK